ncbi:hypothetical protein [Lactobacillus crispatus]
MTVSESSTNIKIKRGKIKMKKSILLVVATLVGVTVAPVLTTNS